jgi:hypothetical protein
MLVFFLIVSVHGRYFNSKICFPRKRMWLINNEEIWRIRMIRNLFLWIWCVWN